MANREDVLTALHKTRSKLLDENGRAIFPGWSRQVLYHLTDLDETWLLRITDGMPQEWVQEKVEEPDIKLTMTSDVLVKLMNGEIGGLTAFTTGQVKIKASMEDLRQLQRLV